MASFSTTLYNTVFKRNSVYVSTIFAGAFAFNMAFDVGIERFWSHWNQGKLWKDIRHKYVEAEDAE
ncbi:ubiquinol-cytochrome C reductase [Vararia minispora EC-137]|uniref:Ubiquinol-cytochrome C reductase n=1 Tax=Vararia minispora EC-137 TaxID=1314806 RepID=A0ACB8QX27_9AGAM|nr:ubiquinol-cytochrome C reductase [Vararia minispora EC-137]